jgi:hypothetical protein
MTLSIVFALCALGTDVTASTPSAALLEAKKKAEAKGYIFETNHEEIVAKAKKEGRVKALTGLDPETFPYMIDRFKKKYPFLEVEMVEITGRDAAQRFVMELKAGIRKYFCAGEIR